MAYRMMQRRKVGDNVVELGFGRPREAESLNFEQIWEAEEAARDRTGAAILTFRPCSFVSTFIHIGRRIVTPWRHTFVYAVQVFQCQNLQAKAIPDRPAA